MAWAATVADIDDLYEALRRADAAGDADGARRIAEHIATMPQPALSSPPRQQGAIEQGLRTGAGAVRDAAVSAYDWAKGAAIGPSDLPDLPEFNPPARPTQQREPTRLDDETSERMMRQGAANVGVALTNNPAAQEDIIRKQYPGARVETLRSQETGQEYKVVDWTDEQGERHIGYINAPGLTGRDAASIAAQGAAYLPAARYGQGASVLTGELSRRAPALLSRMARTGVGTAATRAGLDKAVEPLGSQQGIDPAEAAVTGVAGAAAEVAAPIVAGTYRALRGTARPTSSAARSAAADAGLDADMPESALSEFARVRQTAPPDVAAGAARLNEFNIRATRGQVAQDYQQLNLEDRMRRGLEGPESTQVMKEADAGQRGDIKRATMQVQERLQPSASATSSEAGERFFEGFKAVERKLDAAVDDAYSNVRDLGPARIDVRSHQPLAQRLREPLDAAGRPVDPDLTPATNYVLRQVSERLSPTPAGSVDLQSFELTRRIIGNTLQAAKNPTDKANIRIIRRELDDWLDETVDDGLMSGDPGVVDALKKARAARAQYGRLFEQQGANDAAGAIVTKVLNKAETPEMAMNYILGQGELGRRTQAVGATKRLKEILGEDSDAWNALREAAWNRLARDDRGSPRTAQAFRSAWQRFTLNNQSLKNELFSPEETALMNRYAAALDRTNQQVPVAGTNPSGSAFGIESALRYTLRRLGQREAFVKGNIGSGTILNALARMPLNPLGASDWAKRRSAALATSPLPSQRLVSAPTTAALTPAIQQGAAN